MATLNIFVSFEFDKDQGPDRTASTNRLRRKPATAFVIVRSMSPIPTRHGRTKPGMRSAAAT